MNILYNCVLNHLAANEKLCRLVALAVHAAYQDDIEMPMDKLIGCDWEFARGGQKVEITFVEPYRVESGYLFYLPGLRSDEPIEGALVHIPSLDDDETKQAWYVLKHLAIFAETIELMPDL
jgi:hypothetical protein